MNNIKRISLILAVFLLLSGCSRTQSNPLTSVDGIQTDASSYTDQEVILIPILMGEFEQNLVWRGTWDARTGDVNFEKDAVIWPNSPYDLYDAIAWDGDNSIVAIEGFLDGSSGASGGYDTSLDYTPINFAELYYQGSTIHMEENNTLVLTMDEKEHRFTLNHTINLNGVEQPSSSFSIDSFTIIDDTAYILQSCLGERGLNLICTDIYIPTGKINSTLVADTPIAYSDYNIASYSSRTYIARSELFYMFQTDGIYTINPVTATISKLISIENMPMEAKHENTHFECSAIYLYEDYLIIEKSELKDSDPIWRSSFLFTLDGKYIAWLDWDFTKVVYAFPCI